MARYCFYCGRKLKEGERCDCRDCQQQTSNTSDKSASGSGEAGGTNGSSGSKTSGSSTYSYAHSSQTGSTHSTYGHRAGNSKAKKSNFSFRSVLHSLRKLFTKPTAIIEDAKTAGVARIIIYNLIAALLFSVLLLIFVLFSSISRLSLLRQVELSTSTLMGQALLTMLRGFISAVVIAFLRVFFAYITLRVVARQKHNFLTLFRMYLPGTYYEILVTIFALLFVGGPGLRSLVMLIAGLSIRTLIDYVSYKHTLKLQDDRLLVQNALINILLFISMSFLLNFAVPNLTNFNILPADKPGGFTPNLTAYTIESRI